MDRPHFASVEEYAAEFTNPAFWRPFVQYVCEKHNLGYIDECRAGLAGTNPVFVINQRLVVKFFTPFFNQQAYDVESTFYRQIQPRLTTPTPVMFAQGALFSTDGTGWSYPYIVTTRLDGISIGEQTDITREEQFAAARFAAQFLGELHSIMLPSTGHLSANWNQFATLLAARRKSALRAIAQLQLSPSLKHDLITHLEKVDLRFDSMISPRVLHGDLNEDHVLCERLDTGELQFTGVIDFGDAKTADPIYDLVALHLGMFHGDKCLLGEFLHAYENACGRQLRTHELSRRAMDYTLLYESDVLTTNCFQEHTEWRHAQSLEQLTELIWGI